MKFGLATFLFCVCSFYAFNSSAQAGSLDLSFSTDGKITTSIGQLADQAYAVAVQSDGKIVVAGSNENFSDVDFAVLRYTSNGLLDPTFDLDGIVTTPIGSSNESASAIAIQADGKIVVAGFSYNGLNVDLAVVRYLQNGKLDTSFSQDGVFTLDIANSNDIIQGIAIQSDGKIVLTGSSGDFIKTDFLVLRLLSNGILDSTFDNDGMVKTQFGNSLDKAQSILIQPDSKIVVAGSSLDGMNNQMAFARYLPNGSLDSSFDFDGRLIHNQSSSSQVFSIAIQSDGKIIAFGEILNPNYSILLTRYHSSGMIDSTFDLDGVKVISFPNQNATAKSGVIQSDGKIITAGYIISNTNQIDYLLTRLDTNGKIDSTFNQTGIVTTDFGHHDYAEAMALQQDGKVVLAGRFNNGANVFVSLARYHTNQQVGVEEDIKSFHVLCAPNPFSHSTKIIFPHNMNKVKVEVLTIHGQLILSSLPINSNTYLLNRENLKAGMYLLRIREENKILGNYTLIVQD